MSVMKAHKNETDHTARRVWKDTCITEEDKTQHHTIIIGPSFTKFTLVCEGVYAVQNIPPSMEFLYWEGGKEPILTSLQGL